MARASHRTIRKLHGILFSGTPAKTPWSKIKTESLPFSDLPPYLCGLHKSEAGIHNKNKCVVLQFIESFNIQLLSTLHKADLAAAQMNVYRTAPYKLI